MLSLEWAAAELESQSSALRKQPVELMVPTEGLESVRLGFTKQ